MRRIALIDFGGKIPNLALMKTSTFYKSLGYEVVLLDQYVKGDFEKVFCSVLFTWDKEKAERLRDIYPNIEFGGTGWDIHKKLSPEIENCKPDYDLYSVGFLEKRTKGIMTRKSRNDKAEVLTSMGIGFTSRGCVRQCEFCFVPAKEGKFHQVAEIKDIINPRSKVITLLDNNFTADPFMVEKCQEFVERDLTVDITQGIDVRLMTHEKAKALSSIKHLRSIHYAWDLMAYEKPVFEGIKVLTERFKPYTHLCFMLVGFNTSFEEDNYRLWKLHELRITPYVMIFNKNEAKDSRLKHFARWVNGHFFKNVPFNKYEPWVKAQSEQLTLF